MRTASQQDRAQQGQPPIDSRSGSWVDNAAERRIWLRNLIAAACAGRRRHQDFLTTHGFVFDRGRGITAELRAVIAWIAQHGCWVTGHEGDVWRANAFGVWTKEGIRHDVVLELARLGFLELLAPSGHKLNDGYDCEPGHAKLLRVA